MSYSAYDENGYVGDVGTALGWAELAELLRRTTSGALARLADAGYEEDTAQVAAALRALAPTLPEGTERAGAENLAALAARARGVLIVSDGTEEGTGDGLPEAQAGLFEQSDEEEIPAEEQTEEMRAFAATHDGVWVRTAEGERVCVRRVGSES